MWLPLHYLPVCQPPLLQSSQPATDCETVQRRGWCASKHSSTPSVTKLRVIEPRASLQNLRFIQILRVVIGIVSRASICIRSWDAAVWWPLWIIRVDRRSVVNDASEPWSMGTNQDWWLPSWPWWKNMWLLFLAMPNSLSAIHYGQWLGITWLTINHYVNNFNFCSSDWQAELL